MALRLFEIIFPADKADGFAEIVESEGALGSWLETLDGNLCRAPVLLPINQTESLSDRVRRELGASEGFRMMLFVVEATVPKPEEDAKPRSGTADKKKYFDRVSREELYGDVAAGARLSNVFLVMVALSSIVAAIGLVRDNVAAVVGAMVIAPLLGPNVALSLGTTLGDIPLTWRALKTNAVGVGEAFLLAVVVGRLVPLDPTVTEIASRTSAGVADIVLALAAGAGYGSLALGALMLVLTNVACINLAGVVTFLAQRVRPRLTSPP